MRDSRSICFDTTVIPSASACHDEAFSEGGRNFPPEASITQLYPAGSITFWDIPHPAVAGFGMTARNELDARTSIRFSYLRSHLYLYMNRPLPRILAALFVLAFANVVQADDFKSMVIPGDGG